jgi:hypothetical protein
MSGQREGAVRLAASAAGSSQAPEDQPARSQSGAQWLVLAFYLLGAIALTGRLWLDPASRAQVGDLRDVDQFTWFMRNSATAVAHWGLPALVTTAMNPPQGVNLMWNTSFILPGVLLAPVTLLAGPQVSLTAALTLGFFGSAASMFFVLRRWGTSVWAAALGGSVYGFSPALVNSGIGHYHMQFGVLPPLIIDTLVRIVTGRGRPVRTGIWLGLLIAGQLFIGEEMLIETAVAAAVLLAVLAASRPRAVLRNARTMAIGLGAGAGVALLLSARALWVQFHGAAIHTGSGTNVIMYRGHFTHLYTLPYAFVTPSGGLLLHTAGSAHAAAHYPQPLPEYLAYLGWPLIIFLIAAAILFWRHLTVRVTALTVAILELFSLGGQPVVLHGLHFPGTLLPWYYLERLPVIGSALPDRLCILAMGAAGATLAFSMDLGKTLEGRGGNWRNAGKIAAGAAVVAALPLIPLPYHAMRVSQVPAGWRTAFASLRLPPDSRVLVVPVPWGGIPQPLRWQAETAEPASIIGGDFIAPHGLRRSSRAGREGQTATTKYLDALWEGSTDAQAPSRSQVNADLARWKPAAVIADTSLNSRLGRYLAHVFGHPTYQAGHVLAWRLPAADR